MEVTKLKKKWKKGSIMLDTSGPEFLKLCSKLARLVVNPSRKYRSRNIATFHSCCWTFRKRGRKPSDHVEWISCSDIFGYEKRGDKQLTSEQVCEKFLSWLKNEGYDVDFIPVFSLKDTPDGLCEDKKESWVNKKTIHKCKSASQRSSPLKFQHGEKSDKDKRIDELERWNYTLLGALTSQQKLVKIQKPTDNTSLQEETQIERLDKNYSLLEGDQQEDIDWQDYHSLEDIQPFISQIIKTLEDKGMHTEPIPETNESLTRTEIAKTGMDYNKQLNFRSQIIKAVIKYRKTVELRKINDLHICGYRNLLKIVEQKKQIDSLSEELHNLHYFKTQIENAGMPIDKLMPALKYFLTNPMTNNKAVEEQES